MVHNMCIDENDLLDEEDGEGLVDVAHAPLENDEQQIELGDRRAELIDYFNN